MRPLLWIDNEDDWRSDPAVQLLTALREAGCCFFIEDDMLFVSPPMRRVAWVGDAEAAIEEWYEELKALVEDEARIALLPCAETIH